MAWPSRLTPRMVSAMALCFGLLLLCSSLALDARREAALRALRLRVYAERALDTNQLCMQRLGVERDSEGALASADVPLGGGEPREQHSQDVDELRKGQFERMPRIGARGYGPSVLRHDSTRPRRGASCACLQLTPPSSQFSRADSLATS